MYFYVGCNPCHVGFILCDCNCALEVGEKDSFRAISILFANSIAFCYIVLLWNAYFASVPPFTSLLLIFLWKYAGLDIMLILTALCSVDHNMLDAARMDGAGSVRLFLQIVLPNIVPTLFFSLILTITNTFKIFRESLLLYGEYPNESVYMLQNYLHNHFTKLNYQNISTAALLFFFAIYIVVAIMLQMERKWSDSL